MDQSISGGAEYQNRVLRTRHRERSITRRLLAYCHSAGLTDFVVDLPRNTLTVLCYHRVDVVAPDRFQGFLPNISASPKNFERQIDYLLAHFTTVSIDEVVGWLNGARALPARPRSEERRVGNECVS